MLFQFYRTAKKIIKKHNIDIIHSQWVIPGGFIGGLLSRQYNLPHLITSQGAEFFLPLNHPFSLFTKYTLKRCDYLLPVSHQMGERAVQYGMELNKIKVVPNTVNPSVFKPNISSNFRAQHSIPKDATIILTVRRLVHEKRVEDVLEAFAQINQSNAYLVIGGDGPEREKLETLCKSLNIQNKVVFLGYVANKDLPEIYADSDMYILSSAQEGLSLSLLESMSSGLITITTAATGGNEVIEHGVNGFVYKVGEVARLKDILGKILAMNEIQKSSLRQKSRQTVFDKFSVQKMVGEWSELYKELKK
jgi:glycosyltransferase involved in cell wall biosynthesis